MDAGTVRPANVHPHSGVETSDAQSCNSECGGCALALARQAQMIRELTEENRRLRLDARQHQRRLSFGECDANGQDSPPVPVLEEIWRREQTPRATRTTVDPDSTEGVWEHARIPEAVQEGEQSIAEYQNGEEVWNEVDTTYKELMRDLDVTGDSLAALMVRLSELEAL